jgi:hypothetical protein
MRFLLFPPLTHLYSLSLFKVFTMGHRTVAKVARSAMHIAQAVQGNVQSSPAKHPGLATTDTALNISFVILTGLKSASQFSPVPFIQPAASLALSIVTNVQVTKNKLSCICISIQRSHKTKATRSNDEDFKHLAEDACETVHAIVSSPSLAENNGRKVPRELIQNLQTLIECVKYSMFSIHLIYFLPGRCAR